jgi:hypothetical protein
MLLKRHWDFLGVLLLVLLSIPAAWVLPKTLVLVPSPGFMDDDWHLDAAFKASRGIWIGRDVAFTHGPLFQWLSSLPARSMGLSTGAIYATWNTVPMWCAILFVYFSVRLLIPEQRPGRRLLLLLLVCVFWSPSLRMSCAILLFAVFLRGGYAVVELRAKPHLAGAIAAVLCGGAFLLAADTGMYGVAALLTASAGVVFESRHDARSLSRIAVALFTAALSSVVVAVAINSVMAKPFDFRFWKDTLAMVSAYRWATPYPMPQAGTVRLFATLLAGAVIFGLCIASRSDRPAATTNRTGFLLGGGLFCLVLMQSALVRSDEHHIGAALLATVFLSGAILLSVESRPAAALGALAALACSLFFGEVRTGAAVPMKFEEVAFAPAIIRNLVAELRNPLTECPAGFAEFDRACFAADFTARLQNSADFLQNRGGVQDPIVVFPYQTRYGLAAHRNVAGGLMQAYAASGAALSRTEIAGLEKIPAPAGLYFPDPDFSQLSRTQTEVWRNSDLSLPIDGVSNFTRAPEVWFWMQRHYRAERQIGMGIVGLQRDDARAARMATQEQPLGLTARTYPIRYRRAVLELGTPNWPSGADFLRLRMTVHSPLWWKLHKPERMELELVRADGSSEVQWFVVPPNVSSEIWFYPWSQSGLTQYFDADETRWRLGAGPAIIALRLLVTPLDWASQQPDSVTLEAADAIRLGGGH